MGLLLMGNIAQVQASEEQNLQINFKNAYIDRSYTDVNIENTGSRSQAVSAALW